MLVYVDGGLYQLGGEHWGGSLEDAYWRTRIDDLVTTIKTLKLESDDFENLCEQLGIDYQYVGDFLCVEGLTQNELDRYKEMRLNV